MKSNFRNSRIFKSIVISANLNALMIVLGLVGNNLKPLSFLGKIADVMARPTGFLIGWAIRPHTNSLVTIMIASFEGLIGSIVFYTVVAWVVLQLLVIWRPSKSREAAS